MKLITPMIAQDTDGKLYMKIAKCWTIGCNYKKPVMIREKHPPRCPLCGGRTIFKFVYVGDKLDYSEYFSKKQAKAMARGKNYYYSR